MTDSIGRSWQLGTVQLDFYMPEQFELAYTGADNAEHRPVMIHRALMGSFERFMGILIEHYAGEFPLWLAPVQAVVLPLADRHVDYAREVHAALTDAGLRADVDERTESVGRKIREAELRKVPYMLVVGDREAEQRAVALRRHREGDQGTAPLDEVVERLVAEAASREGLTLERRDSARLVAGLGAALSFRPTLVRRAEARPGLVVGDRGACSERSPGPGPRRSSAQLARRMGDRENAARGIVIGAGAVAIVGQLPAQPQLGRRLRRARSAACGRHLGDRRHRRADAEGGDPLHDPRKRWRRPARWGWRRCVGWQQLMKRSRPRRARMTEWPDPDYLPTVSIGPDSLIPRETLDFEASRFLAGAEHGLSMDPIRVFVGVRSAPTVDERAELAVRELARLGAFERSRIVVISATLRGYVNPIIPDAIETFAGGDCACVVIQYYDKKTLLMPLKVGIAARTHRELLRRLVRHRGAAEVMVYGESLGAWASQNVFRTGGTAALDALGVSRALWIGTPYFSLLRRDFERGKLPMDDRVATVRATDLVEEDPPEGERLRFVFLHRMTDPVVLFPGLELFWRRARVDAVERVAPRHHLRPDR